MESGARLAFGDPAKVLFVDCTANGLSKRPAVDVFQGERIVLQSIFMCQQVFSAAAIAYIEADCADLDDTGKNAMARPCPHPENTEDFLFSFLIHLDNRTRQDARPSTRKWLGACSLNSDSHSSFATNMYVLWRLPMLLGGGMERFVDKLTSMYEGQGHRLGFELLKETDPGLVLVAKGLRMLMGPIGLLGIAGAVVAVVAARCR